MANKEKILWAVKNGDLPGLKSALQELFVIYIPGLNPLPTISHYGALECSLDGADREGKPAKQGWVNEGSFDVNSDLMNGRAALHYAADYGHSDIVEYLCSLKADVNHPDKHGITPLLAAIFEDHCDCARTLIAKGANKSGKGPGGESYLELAESDSMKALLK